MNEDGSRPLSGYVLLFAAVLPLLYILSIGPAAAFFSHSETVKDIYLPLIWLYENVPAVDRPLEWYVGLWGVH